MPKKQVTKSKTRFMLRVTDVNGDRRDLYVNKLLAKVETFAVFEVGHETDKPHYQSVHLRAKQTIVDRLTKLAWTGNENRAISHLWSDTDEDFINVMRYLCKGEKHGVLPVVIVNTFGYTEEQIQIWHNEYWTLPNPEKQNALQGAKVSEEEGRRNKFQKATQWCKDNGITYLSDGWQIVKELLLYYRSLGHCEPSDYQLLNMAKSIQCQLTFEKCKGDKNANILSNYLRDRSRQIVGCSWTMVNPSWN